MITLRSALAALLCLTFNVPTMATPLPAEILDCAAVARDADRLACYDRVVANSSAEARAAAEKRRVESERIAAEEAAVAAAAAAAAATAQAEAAAAAKREAFGAEAIPSRSADRAAATADEVQTVSSTITEVLTNRAGLSVFVLDNGQIWRQLDSSGGLPNIRTGDAVEINRAMLGGYRMTFVKSRRMTPVKRMR